MTKTAFYAQMAEEAAKNITGSYEQWKAFLTTAARLYKYPYPEQLMIFTQRPDATACAEYDLWNDTMHRYIKRGSKGIALIDMTGEKPRLRYVFDVSDTGTRKNSRPVQLWTMLPEHEKPIAEAIDKAFGLPENLGPVEDHIFEAARRLARAYWEDHRRDIGDIVADSYLDGYDEFNVGVSFRRAASNSIAYSIFSRIFGNADDFFGHEDFLDVFDFNTQAASNVLGTAVSEISSQIFREIERTIRTYERSKQAERSQNYDRTHLHAERGLSDPGHSDGNAGNEAPGQVRQDAPGVPAGEPDAFVQPPSSHREAVPAPVGDSGDSSRADGADDGRAAGGEPGTGQENGSDGLGTAHEQPESTGGGDRTDRAGLQLSEPPEVQPVQLSLMDLFPTELEQINHIEEAERMEQMPSAFSFAQNEIDDVLRFGSNTSFSREHIVDAFQKGKPAEEIALLLQREFHGGFGIKGERGDYAAWYAEDGIHLHRGHEAQFAAGSQVIPWEAAAERIGTLLEEGSFAANVEVAEASDRVRSELALHLLYLKHDFSDEGRELGLLPSMDNLPLGYPDATAALADRLKDDGFAGNLQREFSDFLTAYAADRDILRFHYHRIDALYQGLQDETLQHKEYPAGFITLGQIESFITEDEINASLSGGSSVEGGKGRIYRYFTEDHTTKEKADFLKNEYGIGGHSHAVSGADHSNEDHSAKGMTLHKADCPDVVLSWTKAAERIESLIRKDRYLTPEQKEQLESIKTNADRMLAEAEAAAAQNEIPPYERFTVMETDDGYVVWDDIQGGIHVEPDGVSEEFTSEWEAESYRQELIRQAQEQEAKDWLYVERAKQETGAVFSENPVQMPDAGESVEEADTGTPLEPSETGTAALEPEKSARPTATRMSDALLAGDTVYLDGKPFTVESVGMFNVELRDPSLLYPIFRSESKERLEGLLSQDERNSWLMDSVVSLEAPEAQEKETPEPVGEMTAETEAVYPGEQTGLPYDIVVERLHVEQEPSLEEMQPANAETQLTADDFSDFERVNAEYLPHLHERSYEFDCTVKGEKNRLRYEVTDGDDGESFSIHSEQDDVWNRMSTRELEKLSGILETEALYFDLRDDIRAANTTEELRDVEIGIMESQSPYFPNVSGRVWEEFNRRQAELIPARNYRIMDDHLGEGGPKEKFWRNTRAIAVLKQLEEENRPATLEEQHILSQYVGWGGIADAFDPDKPAWAAEYSELKGLLTEEEYAAARASTLNAHFTSPTVIKAIYEAVGNMGFESGNILEPSMGVGNFFGLLPESMQGSRLYGVELDSITGRIAQQLYPKADIKVAGFETTDRRDFYDLAVGNVPFGNYRVADKPYDKLGFSIHNYFFAKTLDQVRPGGVVAFVTSRYTMDAKNPDARKYMAQRAELLGAVRLPNNTFRANAGTDVVSDILFLQKRDHPIDMEPDWVHLGLTPEGISLNSYFVEHPEMVLGELTTESTQYGKEECTVIPIEGAVLSDQLHEAIQHIGGRYEALELMPEDNLTLQGETIPADPNVKNFSYTVVDGEVYFRENSIMRKAELNAAAEGRIKGMVELRGLVQELIDYQLEDYPDEAIAAKQQELNTAYDRFTNTYGILNSRANAQAFSEDSSYYLLCSLENVDENGNLESKADMFTKRTIRPERAVTSVDTPAEALAVSIGERGKVDLPYMAELLGTPGDYDTIQQELHGVIFHDPMQRGKPEEGWQTADEYLSGNVREKLRVAELAAGTNPEYAVNVEYLQRAQPKDLDASEIDVRLGVTWVDRDYIQQFMEETFDPPFYLRRNIEVKFSPMTAEWQITGKSSPSRNDVHAYMTYGTSRANAYRILEDTLNLRDIRIYDTVEDIDGKQKRVLNKKETTLAQQKQQAIKDAFQSWIWKDPYRREALVTKYNELFNSTRPREYDGSHIRFGGMNPEIRLREHQQNAIAHVLYGGNTLLAHEVGAGKTFEMAASAMEAKRLGLCRKSLFVVPNHLTLQWANEFLRLYPSAKLLVASKKDFETARRKKFCARIATGDYDAVIIGHSQFEKIPVSAERQERILTAQIEEIEDALADMKHQRGERFSIKQMEKTRKSLEAKLQKLKATDRKDDVITFEQLGVDRLFVDEAHAFKNLFLYTKMRNVAGLSTSEAQKSSDMFMKCQYMDEITGGRGIIFATGTPVSNSMTELYTMMRYLQYGTLQQKGLTHFDCWASTFGETTTAIELAPEGTGYRARTRFAKFFNLPELMNLFKEVADIKTSDQLHLPVPEAKFETVVVQPSEHQQAMVADLSERAARVHAGMVDPSVDNMLKITSDGRKLGLDQRLMNPLLPDDPDSKLNACVRNVLKIYEEGEAEKLTQLLFCDLSTPKNDGSFNVYDDIKAKLIAAGVPETEVAFIHDADTEAKKKELFAKVRTGQVRVLLGSTQKMGAGTNVQDRLVAVHHLDVGWRPADMTQRNGRIIRQGNRNKQVQVYQYVTEGTFDAYLYQTLENKQKFISQIMTSKSPVRSCDDVDEQALSYAEIKALCAGDPQIKEKMDLDVDVARLKVLKADHQSQQYRLEDKLLKYFPAEIESTQGFIRGFQADIQTVAAHPQPQEGFCGMEVGGRHYAEKADAGEAILAACKDYRGNAPVPLGSYRGFQMELSFESFTKEFQIALKGEMTHRVPIGTSAGGNILRLDNALAGIEARLEKSNQQLESLFSQREAAQAELGKPFPQEAELAEKSARLAELDAILNMDDRGGEEVDSSREDEEKPSVLADLRDRADRIPPADRCDDEEVAL